MPNPLEMGGPPEAPEIQQAPQGNALQGPPQGPQGAPQQAPPAPTHQQTIAALRHFDAVKGELTTVLKDPALGKSSVKSAIIDGVTKLVSDRIISSASAVQQLSKVPDEPLQQRKYLVQMMQQTVQAENAILDHYRQGNPSFAASPAEVSRDAGSPDDHMDHMKALVANYSSGPK